jgi:gluconate kinase
MIIILMGVSGCGKTTVGNMKPDLLASQFATLEEPTDALTVDITLPPELIVEQIIAELR